MIANKKANMTARRKHTRKLLDILSCNMRFGSDVQVQITTADSTFSITLDDYTKCVLNTAIQKYCIPAMDDYLNKNNK